MPVIIDPEDYAAWLDPTNQNIDMLTALLKPYPAASMKAYPVSRRMNNPSYDESNCIMSVDIN